MNRKLLILAYWLLTAVTFIGAVWMIFALTPEERTMGLIQKIFYFHLPIAINTFLGCTIVFVGGIGLLVTHDSRWDDLAVAGAKIAVLLCTLVLVTGMLWAKGAWGVWWTWSPRLTFSFMLWLLFVVYLLVRSSIDGAQRRSVVAAIYGIIAYLDVPLVYLSARLLPDIHPSNISLAPGMKLTLGLSFIPITLLAAGLIVMQYRLERARRAARQPAGFEVVVEPAAELTGGTP